MGLLGDTYTLYVREILIFKKNFRTSIARSAIFPIVLILLLGNLGNTISNLPIAVVNYDNGLNSIRFINTLEAGNMVKVPAYTFLKSSSCASLRSSFILPSVFSADR